MVISWNTYISVARHVPYDTCSTAIEEEQTTYCDIHICHDSNIDKKRIWNLKPCFCLKFVRFSSFYRKRSKMFLFTQAFRIIFSCPLIRFCLKTHHRTLFEAFLLIANPKKIGNNFGVFKSPFSAASTQSHEKLCVLKSTLLKAFSEVSIFIFIQRCRSF